MLAACQQNTYGVTRLPCHPITPSELPEEANGFNMKRLATSSPLGAHGICKLLFGPGRLRQGRSSGREQTGYER